MTDIQRARDVLAKWRVHEAPIEWTSTIPLVIGTAGNPDLLDAIDGLLADALRYHEHDPAHLFAMHGRLIAAAIIAADQRMSA